MQKMEPLTNLQVAIKDSVDIFYFATVVPMHVFFGEDGAMDQGTFGATWRDIPDASETQGQVQDVIADAGEGRGRGRAVGTKGGFIGLRILSEQ